MNKLESFETFSFYRGFARASKPSAPLILKTRKDRKPRDMPKELHDKANEWFSESFGVYYRSQALFVTGSKFTAQNYAGAEGFVARIIPLGDYRFCWSSKNSDLLFLRTKPEHVTVEDYLRNSEYRETDLSSACVSGNEVMLFCDEYVAIPIHLLDDPVPEAGSRILLG